MFKRIVTIISAVIAVMCSIIPVSFSLDQDISDKYVSSADIPEEAVKIEEKKTSLKDKFDVDIFIDLQQGYDNNVDLDPRRREDGFFQVSTTVDTTYKYSDDFKLKAGLDIFDITYYRYNNNNLLDVYPYVGFDYEFYPGLIWKTRASFDYYSYPNHKENTYAGYVLSTYLRNYITRDLYHELGYEFLDRWYPDRKVSFASGFISNSDRHDKRNRIKYKIGFYTDRLFLGLSNEYSENDSNEAYQDYFDYSEYRLKPTAMFFFTRKFYINFNFIYKYIRYKDRRSTVNYNTYVKDDLYMTNASLFYDITKNMTVGLTYSYNENDSSDPYQKYSGSIISGGVYLNF